MDNPGGALVAALLKVIRLIEAKSAPLPQSVTPVIKTGDAKDSPPHR